jgi:hypothetical protein
VIEQGLEKGREEVARNLIAMNVLTNAQIATASGLTEKQVQALHERRPATDG